MVRVSHADRPPALPRGAAQHVLVAAGVDVPREAPLPECTRGEFHREPLGDAAEVHFDARPNESHGAVPLVEHHVPEVDAATQRCQFLVGGHVRLARAETPQPDGRTDGDVEGPAASVAHLQGCLDDREQRVAQSHGAVGRRAVGRHQLAVRLPVAHHAVDLDDRRKRLVDRGRARCCVAVVGTHLHRVPHEVTELAGNVAGLARHLGLHPGGSADADHCDGHHETGDNGVRHGLQASGSRPRETSAGIRTGCAGRTRTSRPRSRCSPGSARTDPRRPCPSSARTRGARA